MLQAGEGQPFPTLAAAVAAAAEGDTIQLSAGEFFECAILRQRNLVLQGAGPGTVITDRTCEGKALLIARADGITVRDLTLARARVPDRNGAGLRLEAPGLRVERVRFENDEVGILAGTDATGTVTITDSVFSGGGVGGEAPSYAVTVGPAALLRITGSSFEGEKGGQVNSGAALLELVGNKVANGAVEPGGFAVSASGRLVARDNVVTVGPAAPPRPAAMVVTGPGFIGENNRLENRTGTPLALFLDWSGGDVHLRDNAVAQGDAVSSDSGKWRHEAGEAARGVKRELRGLAGSAKRTVQGWLGR